MWILCSDSSPYIEYIILIGSEYTVGRKDCHIILQNDMSISRKHAVLWATTANNGDTVLHIKDVSKLGTQLLNERISNGEERTLKHSDVIVFGSSGISKFKVVQSDLVVTTSCVQVTAKKDLRRSLLCLGGQIVSDWTSKCEFVVMETIVVTAKMVCALLSEKHLVTPKYFIDLISSLNSNNNKLNPLDYLPPLGPNVQFKIEHVSFAPNNMRKNLFHNKEFLFLSESQYKRLVPVLKLASANYKLISTNNAQLLVDLELLRSDSSIVIMPDQSDLSEMHQIVNDVVKYLKRNKLRIIAEAELGYAVIHNSIAIFCNPRDASVNSAASFNINTTQVSEVDVVMLRGRPIASEDSVGQQLDGGKRKSDDSKEKGAKKLKLSDEKSFVMTNGNETSHCDWSISQGKDLICDDAPCVVRILVPDTQDNKSKNKNIEQISFDGKIMIENTQDQIADLITSRRQPANANIFPMNTDFNRYDSKNGNVSSISNVTNISNLSNNFISSHYKKDNVESYEEEEAVTVVNDSFEDEIDLDLFDRSANNNFNMNIDTPLISNNNLVNDLNNISQLKICSESIVEDKSKEDDLVKKNENNENKLESDVTSRRILETLDDCSIDGTINKNKIYSAKDKILITNCSNNLNCTNTYKYTNGNVNMNVNMFLDGDWYNIENLSAHIDTSFELAKEKPVKVVVVEARNLMRTVNVPNQLKTNNDVSNFKKFKSKNSLRPNLPKIIGGRDLAVHSAKSGHLDFLSHFQTDSTSRDNDKDIDIFDRPIKKDK